MSRNYQKRDQVDPLTTDIMNHSNIVLQKSDIGRFIQYSENFGILCQKKRVTTTQIRRIFQEVKRLPNEFEKSKVDLNLLRPKLAYQKGRFSELTDIQKLFDHLIKNIHTDLELANFKEFFEAIICYHKAHGGK